MQDEPAAKVAAWRSQLKKGSLELAVLLLLRQQRRYGLELVDLLQDLEVSEGSIYPLLARLRAEKSVETEWVDDGVGHAHKYYRLTARGGQVLAGMLAGWAEHTRAVQKLIGGAS